MTVDGFAWLFVTVVFGGFTFLLGHYAGSRNNRAFYLDQLRQSTQREMEARDELHRITIALGARKEGGDGGQS